MITKRHFLSLLLCTSLTVEGMEVIAQTAQDTIPTAEMTGTLQEVVIKADHIIRREGISTVRVAGIPGLDKMQTDRILEQIPGVIRNEDGSFTLGGETATVYINGVRQNISAASLKAFLSALPASAVSTVQLIPVNTGQYSSDTKAVIDIRINSNIPLGYTFIPSVTTSLQDGELDTGQADLFYMTKKGRWLFHNSLMYSNENQKNRSADSLLVTGRLLSAGTTRRNGRYNVINWQASLSYQTKKENNLVLDAFVYNDFGNTRSHWDNLHQSVTEKKDGRNDLYNLAVSYSIPSVKKLFNGIVTASVSYGGRHADMKYAYPANAEGYTGKTVMEGWLNCLSAAFATQAGPLKLLYGGQVDYNSVWDKASYDNRQTMEKQPAFSGNELLSGAYIQTRYALSGNLSLQGGIRMENTRYEYHYTGSGKQTTDHTDLFPSLMLYLDSPSYNMSFGLLSQIYRPHYKDMLPGLHKVNDYIYTRGNPDIRPTDIWQLLLHNTLFGFLQANITYTRANGALADAHEPTDGGWVISRVNAGDYHGLRTNLVLPYSLLSDKISGQVQFNANYKKLFNLRNGFRLPQGRKASYWSWTGHANINYRPTDRWLIMLTGAWSPETDATLFHADSYATVGADITCSMLKDRSLALTLSATGLWAKDRTRDEYFPDGRRFTRQVDLGPIFGISLRWKLGRGQNVTEEYREYAPQTDRF